MTEFEAWLEEAWRYAKTEILIGNTLNTDGKGGKTIAKALRMLEVAVKAYKEYTLEDIDAGGNGYGVYTDPTEEYDRFIESLVVIAKEKE